MLNTGINGLVFYKDKQVDHKNVYRDMIKTPTTLSKLCSYWLTCDPGNGGNELDSNSNNGSVNLLLVDNWDEVWR